MFYRSAAAEGFVRPEMQVAGDAQFRRDAFDREQRSHRIILPRLTRGKDAGVQLHANRHKIVRRAHARARRETAARRGCNSRTGANSWRSAIALPAMAAVR